MFSGGNPEATLYVSEIGVTIPDDVAPIEPPEATTTTMAPPPIFAAEDYAWREMSQQTCLEIAAQGVQAAVDSFGLILDVFTATWYVEAAAADPNIAIMCLTDSDDLVDAFATRVLAIVSVYSTDRDLALGIRDFLEDWLDVQSPANTGDISWITSATPIAAELGSQHSFVCPPTDDPQSFGIWGTEIYTDDSGICLAAVHAGVITFDGGPVTIELLAGQETYTSSERNGVTSLSFGPWTRSFRFVPSSK